MLRLLDTVSGLVLASAFCCAYDPKDPADKKIVDGLIKEALDAAADDPEHDVHAGVVQGLKDKNKQLLADLKKAKKDGNRPEAVAELESQLEQSQDKLAKAEADLKTATKELGKAKTSLETESVYTRRLLVDNGLTEALTKANVAKEFLPAVKALMAAKVEIKTQGEDRKAFVGDKELGSFIAEWSQSDEGKHYVVAFRNNGGGANGGRANGSGKTVTRAVFGTMDPTSQAAHVRDGGTVTE